MFCQLSVIQLEQPPLAAIVVDFALSNLIIEFGEKFAVICGECVLIIT
jgi:hypothetical protein